MYTKHWRLTGQPFENRWDSQFYYPAEDHQAALMKLHYAVENRRAAALVCGPTGIGKTLLVHELRRQLDEAFQPLIHLVFPAMNEHEWLRSMVDALDGGSSEPATNDRAACLRRFEKFLSGNLDRKQHAVVVIDEAHLLEQNYLLEPLRLLLNVAAERSGGESAWTLVLVGQESLPAQVERYHALDERLAVKCLMNRFKPEETQSYIQHRLRVVGGDANTIFTPEALDAVESLSQGLPRRINRLCDLALMIGFAEETPRISADIIENVYQELAPPIGA
ncbi:MAG: AAA family ATPase [Pirellulales bacterium]